MHAQGCSVYGLRETEPSDLLIVEETEPQVLDPVIDVGKLVPVWAEKQGISLEQWTTSDRKQKDRWRYAHLMDKEAAATGIQETVTASPLLLVIGDEVTEEVCRLCHANADLNAQDVGKLVPEDSPPLMSNSEIERQDIFGHRSEYTSSATGQEVGGSTPLDAGIGATLSLPSFNIN